jgi:hypothetical protein
MSLERAFERDDTPGEGADIARACQSHGRLDDRYTFFPPHVVLVGGAARVEVVDGVPSDSSL